MAPYRHKPARRRTFPPVAELIALGRSLDADWRTDAACIETDPEVFYPETGASLRPAYLVCGGCAVKVECAAFALANNDLWGVWGGVSGQERARMLRDARRAQAVMAA